MTYINIVRNSLRTLFGAHQYRITRAGEIHVYGRMPNTNMVGWYLYGQMASSETLHRLGAIT